MMRWNLKDKQEEGTNGLSNCSVIAEARVISVKKGTAKIVNLGPFSISKSICGFYFQKDNKPNCSDYMDIILTSQSAIPIKEKNGTQSVRNI